MELYLVTFRDYGTQFIVNDHSEEGAIELAAEANKTLGEIASISRGGSFQKKDFKKSGVPCIHYGQIYTHYNLFAEKTLAFLSPEVAKKQKMC